MPFTFLVTWVGTLALAAIPPVYGFWSKDAIFAATYDRPGLAACSMLAGFFTSFFMLRMILVAFDGKPRTENAKHAHEGPPVMVVPMLILAVLSVFGGMFPVAEFLGMKPEHPHHAWTLWLSLILAVAGFFPAHFLYRDALKDPLHIPLLQGKFYVDEIYQRVLVATRMDLVGWPMRLRVGWSADFWCVARASWPVRPGRDSGWSSAGRFSSMRQFSFWVHSACLVGCCGRRWRELLPRSPRPVGDSTGRDRADCLGDPPQGHRALGFTPESDPGVFGVGGGAAIRGVIVRA